MISLESLLESVADAVSSLVTFAAEAGNNQTVLVGLTKGVKGLHGAVNYLVGQARQTVGKWEDLGSPEMAAKMSEQCDGLQACVKGIVDGCANLNVDPNEPTYKNAILEEGKNLLKHMVALLQFNDLYDVMVALKAVKAGQTLLQDSFDSAVFPIDDFKLLLEKIQLHITTRQELTHDSRCRQMLEESKDEIEQLKMPFCTIIKKSWTAPAFKQKIPIIHGPLIETLEKTEKAIKLSAKSPYDLSMLDNEMTNFNFGDDLAAITVSHSDIDFQDQLKAIKKAVKDGDEFELERALRAIEKNCLAQIANAEEIAHNTADPNLRADMLRRINNARNQLPAVLDKLRSDAGAAILQKQPLDARALEGIDKLYNSIAKASALSELQVASDSLEGILKELKQAAKNKDRMEADALVKDAQKEIEVVNKMSKILANTAEDDYRKNRILNDAGKIQDHGKKLKPDVDGVFKDLPQAQQVLNDEITEILKLNKDLLTATAISTQNEILENASHIQRALVDLDKKKTDPTNAAFDNALKEALHRVNPQVNLVNGYADSLQDTEKAKDIKSKARALQRAMDKANKQGESLKAGYNTSKHKDKDVKKFVETLNKVKEANQALAHSCIDAPNEMFDLLRGKVAGDEVQLRSAIQAGRPKDIALTCNNLKCDFQDTLFLADMTALDMDDQKLIGDLLKTSEDLSNMLNGLLPATKAYAKEPWSGSKAEDKFDDLLGNMMKGLDSLAPEKVLGMRVVEGRGRKKKKELEELSSSDSNLLGKLDEEKQRRIEEAEKLRLEQERLKAEAERKRLEMLALMQKPLEVVEEIWEAATQVHTATLGLEEDDGSAGSLVALARQLARMMQELSALSKTGTKQQITDLGKKIANMINKLQEMIEEACKGCRDPILCQEMRDCGHVAKNFSIQLKIISGVKASMILENDPDAATALITCCKGMCGSVSELVKLSQIAKLKPINQSTRSLPKK